MKAKIEPKFIRKISYPDIVCYSVSKHGARYRTTLCYYCLEYGIERAQYMFFLFLANVL